MLLTLKGTPFLYYGEEIGMRNGTIGRAELQDPLGRRTWPLPLGRDPERTPMQWSDSEAAGFTSATPWLPVNRDYRERNVARQRSHPGSILAFYRALLKLRKDRRELAAGEIEFMVSGEQNCPRLRGIGDRSVAARITTARRRGRFLRR